MTLAPIYFIDGTLLEKEGEVDVYDVVLKELQIPAKSMQELKERLKSKFLIQLKETNEDK